MARLHPDEPAFQGIGVRAPQYSMSDLSSLMNSHTAPNFKAFGKWGPKA